MSNSTKTLILPLVSTGNVPQLCTDIVLHSLSDEFVFVKSLDSMYVHPFIGALDYSAEDMQPVLYRSSPEKKLTSALELFYDKSRNLYVIQQRTPIIQGYINNFIKEVIIPLVDELQITHLTVLDSYGTLDESIIAQKFATNSAKGANNIDPYFSMGVCRMGSIDSLSSEFDTTLNLQVDPNTSQHYTNSLLTFTPKSLVQEVSTEQQIFKIIYHLINSRLGHLQEIKYCSFFAHEGDNSLDAGLFASRFKDFVQPVDDSTGSVASITHFKTPVSWKGVYGFNEVPSTLEEGIYI